jgi:hypothetical protein
MVMSFGSRLLLACLVALLVAASVHARAVSREQAEAFARKVTMIQRQGAEPPTTPRRTSVSQDELNSWFTYRAQPLLPSGVTQPEVAILGAGRVQANAIVDLEEVAKRRASGSRLDPWNLLGGRVPLTVTGVLHTRNGVGSLELQQAHLGGVPVPVTLVHELVGYYSRSERRPNGIRLTDPFALPSNIREIQVGQGQAVIVQ